MQSNTRNIRRRPAGPTAGSVGTSRSRRRAGRGSGALTQGEPHAADGVLPQDPPAFLVGEMGEMHELVDGAIEVVPGEISAEEDTVAPRCP